MQNPALWCIFGSENKQLLTGADPEGMARDEGRVGKVVTPKASTSEAPKAPSRRRRWRRGVGNGEEVSASTANHGVWGAS